MDVIRFESFEVDRGAYQLRRAGRPVAIERIPMELLLLLLERRGQLVTRQEILDRIWGKNVFGDVDNSINTAVRKIRQVLHDNPGSPRLLRLLRLLIRSSRAWMAPSSLPSQRLRRHPAR